jgi:glycerate 2-kinase
MIIRNKKSLSLTSLRRRTLTLVETGISRVLPGAVMREAVCFDGEGEKLTVNGQAFGTASGRIFVIGGGKASGQMAQALEEIIGADRITAGVVNTTGSDCGTNTIETIEASHPTPDQRGVRGVEKMLALKEQYEINENDLVICLISGGGSALMPCPAAGIDLGDKQEMTELLIKRGPSIREINAVRKHLSRIKGGRLGAFFAPARVVSLILSDVVGNDMSAIASGPTVADSTTFRDAWDVLERYRLAAEAPPRIRELLRKGCAGNIEDTPIRLDNCRNFIIGDIRTALEAMAVRARDMGLKPIILTAEQTGAPATAAKRWAGEIKTGTYRDYDVLLLGGETTPLLPANHGKGGRNMHYAAVSMQELYDYAGEWTMASVGTDGSDFLPGIAGAIVDQHSCRSTAEKNIDVQAYVERFDSHSFFETIGDSLVVTGNTGTNVGDIVVYVL